jgi:hypothetical protein
MLSIIFVSVIVTAEPSCNTDSKSKSHIKRLKKDLFRDYDSSVRPVRLRTDRTQVAVEMIPLSLNLVSLLLLIASFPVIKRNTEVNNRYITICFILYMQKRNI